MKIKEKVQGKNFRKFSLLLLLVMLLGSISINVLLYKKWDDATAWGNALQGELYEIRKFDRVVASLKKVINVTDSSQPTVFFIEDVDKFREENTNLKDVLKDIKNGDAVISFQTQAYIFRESENKIINVFYLPQEQTATQ
ncbi:hypothetical protein IPJ91_02915 [bacterium]|nr:MAG: hypothetical protein IPJ91_02915 [bacterium]